MNENLSPLKARRIMRGWKLRDVGRKIGRSHQAVSDWERGRYPIPDDVRRALAKAYGVPVKSLDEWPLDTVKRSR